MHESINIHVFMEAIINIHDASHCSECSQHSLSHSFCRYYDGAQRTTDSSQNVEERALNRVAHTEVVNDVKKINNSQQLKIKNILNQYQQQHYIQNIFY